MTSCASRTPTAVAETGTFPTSALRLHGERPRYRLAALLLLASIVVATGCSWAPTQPHDKPARTGDWARWERPAEPAAPPAPLAPARQAVDLATGLIGTPYRWGGATPAGFDCSGLVYYTFRKAGVTVPRTSQQQFHLAQPVPLDDAQPGDLVFFGERGRISHVGIYLGDERFVHAPDRGRAVSIATLSDGYYRRRFAGAGRLCC